MSDSEKKPEIDETEAPLPIDIESTELELGDGDEFKDFESEFEKKPSLKDFLNSPDSPSRYLMIISLLFGSLALVCAGLLVFQYLKHRHSEQKVVIAPELIKLEPSFEERLGEFKVNWNDGELRADLVIQCASAAVCEALKGRKIEARDRILPILQDSSRAEILNPTKKQQIRQRITESLNEMKLPGKVLEANFSDLTVEIAH